MLLSRLTDLTKNQTFNRHQEVLRSDTRCVQEGVSSSDTKYRSGIHLVSIQYSFSVVPVHSYSSVAPSIT